jgi:hypothetical protein
MDINYLPFFMSQLFIFLQRGQIQQGFMVFNDTFNNISVISWQLQTQHLLIYEK